MDNNILAGEDTIISSESEQLILVDDEDHVVGHTSKAQCHQGQGVLHRAFSLFIFNDAGELLLQQRSAQKRLWPLFWSNSCCSHPRRGESMEQAVHRRLEQELGLTGNLHYLYKFKYRAQFGDIGAEHELCWVYIGKSSDTVAANRNEIAAWRFVSGGQLDNEMKERPDRFTPWFKLEWNCIKDQYSGVLAAL